MSLIVEYIELIVHTNYLKTKLRQELARCSLASFLKCNIFLAHFMLLGNEFHKVADEVSIMRLPWHIVLFRLGTNDVDADLSS